MFLLRIFAVKKPKKRSAVFSFGTNRAGSLVLQRASARGSLYVMTAEAISAALGVADFHLVHSVEVTPGGIAVAAGGPLEEHLAANHTRPYLRESDEFAVLGFYAVAPLWLPCACLREYV